MELLGVVMLKIADQQFGKIRVLVDNKDQRSLQFQVWELVTSCSSSPLYSIFSLPPSSCQLYTSTLSLMPSSTQAIVVKLIYIDYWQLVNLKP